jgi:mannose-6-phosphate isomerase-like protein (cupin superfamily)
MSDRDRLTPFVTTSAAPAEHLPLLTAANARAMRAGVVTLAPGEGCGRHSTGSYEELLIILEGEGEARLEGPAPLAVGAGRVCYIPPRTSHEVVNTGGRGPLRYVYVVAPAADNIL